MKELNIGEIFEYNGEWYQCIVGNGCENCAFNGRKCYLFTENNDPIGECCADRRKDNKDVIFKKLEKIEEPPCKSCYFGMVQLYKLPYWNNGMIEPVGCHFTGDGYVLIEIKQNKEDMGEKQLNLKPFDIQKAKEGYPVYTRDGRKARIVCFDRICGDDYYKIVACVTAFDEDFEEVLSYGIDGYIVDSQNPKDEDLMMLPEKKEGWVNVYKDSVYDTKDEALIGRSESRGYIDTIKVRWEE